MEFDLCKIDWTAIAAFATFCACIVAIFVPIISHLSHKSYEKKSLILDIDILLYDLTEYHNTYQPNFFESWMLLCSKCYAIKVDIIRAERHGITKYKTILNLIDNLLKKDEFHYQEEFDALYAACVKLDGVKRYIKTN